MLCYDDIVQDLDWRHIVLAVLVVILFIWVVYLLFRGWWVTPITPVQTFHPPPRRRREYHPLSAPPPKPAPKGDRIIKRKKCSKGEAECRRVLEKIFQAPFPTIEPEWLINPNTGARMEIDAYNRDIGIGLEYHGKQHYDQTSFQQSDETFAKQNERDALKFELCKQNNVYLITVPYTVPFDQIEDYIVYYLPWNRKTRLDNDMTE